MYKLFWAQGTGSFVAQMGLEACGAPYEKVIVDTHAWPAGYEKLNPMKQVPAVLLPDGTVVTESAAILLHLGDAFPASNLLPPTGSSQRAECFRWLAFVHANIYETLLRLIYAERYTTEQSRESLRGIRNGAKKRMPDLLKIVEDRAFKEGTYVVGSQPTAVDFYVFFVAASAPKIGLKDALNDVPKIRRLYEVMKKHPAVARIYEQHFPPKAAAKI